MNAPATLYKLKVLHLCKSGSGGTRTSTKFIITIICFVSQ